MKEDGAEDGNSGQRPNVNTTAVKDGQAGTAIAFGNAKIENLSINAAGLGHSRQVPENPGRDEYRNAVQVTLRGDTLSTITIPETIPVHNGKVSILGDHDDQNVKTTATCEHGKIVHLEANCGRPLTTNAACRTKWMLSNITGALSKLMAFCFKGLKDITCAFMNKFGVHWVRAEEGSLVLEFGHGTKQDAENMVSNKVEVTHLLKQLLGNCNIHDAFIVDNVEVMDECDDVTELPSTSTGKGWERLTGHHYATSQSASRIYSVSSGGAHAQADHQVHLESELGKLSIDEEVDGCDACRKYKDPDVTTNQVVIHINVEMVDSERNSRRRMNRRMYIRKKQFEMTKKASALRNSGGGDVFCHLSGKNKINRCLGQFDEVFLNPQIFYPGEWFEDTDFLVITVSQ
ncbi:uncharacterized protein LOC124261670 isoform X2 [Haliotis rubra]|uniref:uncharacterized protein LOC124261670 isoform X2 n=1 Tax=Haliotis rubra TaxID=36100 RepID=UPI001EE5108D|nr:uncharacterized protein LOC124261670 isoform X2 [Haliotis rubra]